MKVEVSRRLASARKQQHADLSAYPNALGTAIGYKRRGGARTRTPAVIVYVREKAPPAEIDAASKIPARIKHGRTTIATDVVALGKLGFQFGPPPWFCADRPDNQGTVTVLCRTVSGAICALTCAHCIGGSDRDPSTPETILLWDDVRRTYLPVGVSGPYASTTGMGTPNDFGFSDWGLFSIQDPQLQARAQSAPPMSFGPIQLGMPVATSTAHGTLQGIVEHAQINVQNYYVDLAIHVENGGTFGGDSGSLWRNSDGRGIGIHAMGMTGAGGSPYSFCMYAQRIAATLQQVGVLMVG